MEKVVTSISLKTISEEDTQILNKILLGKDPIQAYQFLFYKNPEPIVRDTLFEIILESNDCRVMYETALSIDDAPVMRFYERVKKLNSTYFISLFELDILK